MERLNNILEYLSESDHRPKNIVLTYPGAKRLLPCEPEADSMGIPYYAD